MSFQEQLQQLLMAIWQPTLYFFSSFIIIAIIFSPLIVTAIIITILIVKYNQEYKKEAYYQVTKLPYFSVRSNIGRYGEYLIYKHLRRFEYNGAKFLFNLYIPKENDNTTEIDVLMICSKGIFVFESKNYSGWIFGDEKQKNWCQTLPLGKGKSNKEHFYNPIMQNRTHINSLKLQLGEQIPIHSIIVFSDRCTLKNIRITSNDIRVINRNLLSPTVSNILDKSTSNLLCENDIENIYNKLYPYTQANECVKEQHIASIRNHTNQQTTPHDSAAIQTFHTETSENENKEIKLSKCPKCNGTLVLRTATRGLNTGRKFYGCSNYPKCKYIQNL